MCAEQDCYERKKWNEEDYKKTLCNLDLNTAASNRYISVRRRGNVPQSRGLSHLSHLSADAFHIFVNPSRERTDGTGAERKISSANLIAFYALLLIVALKQEAAVGIGKSSHVTRSVECE